MEYTLKHLSTSIEGILNFHKNKKIDFLESDDGTTLSDKEARAELNLLLKQGHRLIKSSEECYGFDPVKGCPGHNYCIHCNIKVENPKYSPCCSIDCWIAEFE